MRDYTLLIEDDRYSVPTLLMVTCGSTRVREIALDRLRESPHHIAVDVLEADVPVFRIHKSVGVMEIGGAGGGGRAAPRPTAEARAGQA